MSDKFCLDIRSPTERLILYANPRHSSASQHLFLFSMLTEQLFAQDSQIKQGAKEGWTGRPEAAAPLTHR